MYPENSIRNIKQPRTFGALCMRTTSNMLGTYLFMSLVTSKVIRRRDWVEMLPGEVIDLNNIVFKSQSPKQHKYNNNYEGKIIHQELEFGVQNFGRFSPDQKNQTNHPIILMII